MRPNYDLDKIKFATDQPTFERAVKIYESGGVKDFKDSGMSGFSARVRGSGGNFYNVFISARHYDAGDCDCYLGQNDTLCKHMVSAAIYAVKQGEPFKEEEKEYISSPVCSGKKGELNKEELAIAKKEISSAIKYVKAYEGPSRIWFAYQSSLSEGCNRLAKIVSDLPASRQIAGLLIDMLLRLDKKLCEGGVDDSNGTVGGFIEETAVVLEEYAKLDPDCAKAFNKLAGRETCFGWEEPLLEILDR